MLFFFKQKTAYEMRISDWSSDVCSSDLIQYIDKRILGVNMERQQVLSTDQPRLQVDAFARFRITNPVRMYTAIRNEEKLQTQLETILGSSLRNELGTNGRESGKARVCQYVSISVGEVAMNKNNKK